MIFDSADFLDHEQVVFASDPDAGLRAIIAVHSTALGPSLGGCRIKSYPNETAAAHDVLRLSQGMTYKAALAGLPLGGGKSVIMLKDGQEKTPALMRAMGRAVERLGGRYIAAEDVGATPADMDAIGEETSHVAGRSSDVGDPAPWTAEGVYLSIVAAAKLKLDRSDLEGLSVVVKGLGAVGGRLAKRLAEAGAALTLADIDTSRLATMAEELGAATTTPDKAIAVEAEVFAPCALGADLSMETIPSLKARIVCGSANNQLARPEDGVRLARAGVLYCPDYLVNAGGLISVARPALGMDEPSALAKLQAIPKTLEDVVKRAEAEDGATAEIADQMAQERVARAARARAA